jgi:hypothetical protein
MQHAVCTMSRRVLRACQLDSSSTRWPDGQRVAAPMAVTTLRGGHASRVPVWRTASRESPSHGVHGQCGPEGCGTPLRLRWVGGA